MNDNVKALLEYLNLPTGGAYIISPTSFYLVEGPWHISPKEYGVSVTTINSNTNVRDLKAYALLMRVIGDPKHLTNHMEQVIGSLIRRVTNCTMDGFTLNYDPDGVSIEVVATQVCVPSNDGSEDEMVPRRIWRIDTDKKTLRLYTPNLWILEVTRWDVESHYQDIAGCLILLNNINKQSTRSIHHE